jgi:glycosyltransferase involved in cell wall biosynthesis
VRLLLITQRVDRNDPILGFFHRWIEEFAKESEKVTVIGQQVGTYALPTVRVVSLGKEQGVSPLCQILRFSAWQWRLRREYDTVLVHMTPIWIVLGAPLWLLFRKRIFLWYEARGGGWVLPLALLVVQKVFSATERGMPRQSERRVIVGHGIDTTLFHPPGDGGHRTLLLTVGRITPVKSLEVIIRCLCELPPAFHLTIVGGVFVEADQRYLSHLQSVLERQGLSSRVEFRGWVPYEELPSLLQKTDLYLHAAGGGLDKVILEAMACGCLVLSASEATEGLLPERCQTSREELPRALRVFLSLSEAERATLRRELRTIVERHHSLPDLIRRLLREMESSSEGEH